MLFVQGIMEGKEWVWNNGLIKEADVADIKENIEENRTNNAKDEFRVLQSFFKNFNFINKFRNI